jgi:pyridoxal phosphate enzyme (YggS family)
MIRDNIEDIRGRMRLAAQKSGRHESELTLIGVTKTIDIPDIEESLKQGIIAIGENKPQEILRKHPLVKYPVQWHMIGNLQTNKVKMIVDKVDLIHTLDSLKLALEIQKRAQSIDRVIPCLIQVNIGEESQKNGVEYDDVEALIDEVKNLPNIEISGLMCIAPFLESPEDVRPYFRKMKTLFDVLKNLEYNRVTMKELSMGMTHDFEVAIEEGATMIRVGTGIYGSRNY